MFLPFYLAIMQGIPRCNLSWCIIQRSQSHIKLYLHAKFVIWEGCLDDGVNFLGLGQILSPFVEKDSEEHNLDPCLFWTMNLVILWTQKTWLKNTCFVAKDEQKVDSIIEDLLPLVKYVAAAHQDWSLWQATISEILELLDCHEARG